MQKAIAPPAPAMKVALGKRILESSTRAQASIARRRSAAGDIGPVDGGGVTVAILFHSSKVLVILTERSPARTVLDRETVSDLASQASVRV